LIVVLATLSLPSKAFIHAGESAATIPQGTCERSASLWSVPSHVQDSDARKADTLLLQQQAQVQWHSAVQAKLGREIVSEVHRLWTHST
jgi:hypothetical protein